MRALLAFCFFWGTPWTSSKICIIEGNSIIAGSFICFLSFSTSTCYLVCYMGNDTVQMWSFCEIARLVLKTKQKKLECFSVGFFCMETCSILWSKFDLFECPCLIPRTSHSLQLVTMSEDTAPWINMILSQIKFDIKIQNLQCWLTIQYLMMTGFQPN